MRLVEVPIDIFLYSSTMSHFPEIAKEHWTEMEINVRFAEHFAEVFYH